MTDADRIAALAARIPGSQHLEAAIAVAVRNPQRVGAAQDRGIDARSLAEAQQRHARLEAAASRLTAEERDAVWSDPSPEAMALRRVMRWR